MAQRRISYTVRDFQAIRQELINYTRTYYPELIDRIITKTDKTEYPNFKVAELKNNEFDI